MVNAGSRKAVDRTSVCPFRIGIDVGDIIIDGDETFATASTVQLARVADLSSIAIAPAVRENIRNKLKNARRRLRNARGR